MSPTKMLKCKDCGSPFPSSDEVPFAKCPACLRKDRMKEAAEVVSNVKTAKKQTPPRLTSQAPEEEKQVNDVNHQQNSDSGFNHLVGVKVSSETLRRLDDAIEASGMTKAEFLRAILEDGVTNWR